VLKGFLFQSTENGFTLDLGRRKPMLYPVLDRLHIPRPARNSGFHRFRHSVGSFVNAETGNLKLAQKLLGHSRYETTANIYTHSTSDQDREAAVAVEQAIFGESVRNVRENTNNKGPQVITKQAQGW
jgi:integrase